MKLLESHKLNSIYLKQSSITNNRYFKMFSENFDDIEESLRDDLRRNGYRHVIKNEAKNEMLQCEVRKFPCMNVFIYFYAQK